MAQSGDQDQLEGPHNTKEEDDEEWTLCESTAKQPQRSSGDAPPRHSLHSTERAGRRSYPYKTPEEAAWELRNEVVTLELKNSTGNPDRLCCLGS